MDQQEARDILKGCGGCLLIIVILFILAFLMFAFGEKILIFLCAIPFWFLLHCGPWIVVGLLVLLAIAFIVFMIKVILKACGII